jgi:uncharacterized protein (DUF1501 family)
VTIAYSGQGWDTRVQNDLYQSMNWEGLFSGLLELQRRLAAVPGDNGGTLADETVVVVLSEMGRTPQLNANDGKDHWPYTSMLMTGPAIGGNRVIGGYDALYYGLNIDPATAELDDDGVALSSSAVGASLLTLCGIDPAEYLSGTSAIPGLFGA